MQEQIKTFFCEKCNKEKKIPRNLLGKADAVEKARERHYHKEHTLILGIKFKIYPEKKDLEKINEYFDEYAKAVNFAARLIDKLKGQFLFMGKRNKEDEERKYIFPIARCDFCGEEKEISYQNKRGKKICFSCYQNEFGENGIRKKLYATKGRKVNASYNIKNATNKLCATHYNYVIRDAFQLLDALKKQREKRISRLIRDKGKLKKFEEMLEQEDKRYELPKKERQREPRFIHISLKDRAQEFEGRGYTIKRIKEKIKVLRRNIEREEKSLNKKTPIEFSGKRITLSSSLKFNIEKSLVRIPLTKELTKDYKFGGMNVANEHGRKFFEEKLKLIKENKPKYSYLIRKQINKDPDKPFYDYYLQYTVEFLPEVKQNYKRVIGIDRGIDHLACLVLLENGKEKPSFVKFFSGKDILKLRNQRRKQLSFLIGVHNKKRKQKKIRPIEPKIHQILHTISKQIVMLSKQKEAAISLEQLEKPKKGKYKQSKSTKYKLGQFVFKALSDYIEYKAKKEGIRVIYVPPEMTSQICSHCAIKGKVHVDTKRPYKNSYKLFKCNKDGCGVELNADYNAAFNIAQKGLKILNSK